MIFEGEYINDFSKEMEKYVKSNWLDNMYFRPYCLKEFGSNHIVCFRVPGYTVGHIELDDNGIIIKIETYTRGINAFNINHEELCTKLKEKFVGKKFEWGISWSELIKDYDEDKK